ncbi:MAG: NAD(P)(+) transhydrogenase (Re/Si-specific) subunit beta, partial [Coriobacteriia bacterium]|nr:NAD(P)(+) transhydrogenase (Re/Si-specific) subunit beta [Coriobacteriia bacterium]
MRISLIAGSFIIAGLLFILALAGLSKHETSKRGNIFGAIGMGIALIFTILGTVFGTYELEELTDGATMAAAILESAPSWSIIAIVAAMAVGAVFGIVKALKVEMTGMPQLIALFHSFVGLAAVLVGWTAYYGSVSSGHFDGLHSGELFVGVFIGAVTFTGSIIAYLKLSAKMKSAPLVLPGHNILNLVALIAFVALTVLFILYPEGLTGLILLSVMTIIALLLGLHLVASIGGGDMPVVVSMLNSYS